MDVDPVIPFSTDKLAARTEKIITTLSMIAKMEKNLKPIWRVLNDSGIVLPFIPPTDKVTDENIADIYEMVLKMYSKMKNKRTECLLRMVSFN